MPRGRPRTGSVSRHEDHLDVRITLPDGTRSPARCLPAGTSKERAREIGRAMTEEAVRRAVSSPDPAPPVPPVEESIDAWSDRWCAVREAKGLDPKDNKGHLKKWILPLLTGRPMAHIQSEELERVVAKLDDAVLAEEISWKTASNAWGTVTKMFADACRAKKASLRVRNDNPSAGVEGPEKGDEKAKAYLYPSEFLALMRCPRVPLRWRRLFAMAVYGYMRPGELEALGPGDVDRERNIFHVHQAIDRPKGRQALKSTKTGRTRYVPIEPTLWPLVDLFLAEAPELGTGRLLVVPAICDLSDRLRKYLGWAGVTRAQLFANDKTRKQITFYDLRATGITWMAIRGDEPLRIQSRAGHEDFRTTQSYIREAENLEGAVRPDEVFPPLPEALFSSPFSSGGPGSADLAAPETEESSSDVDAQTAHSSEKEAGHVRETSGNTRVRIPLGTPLKAPDSKAIEDRYSGPDDIPDDNARALTESAAGLAALRWLDGDLDRLFLDEDEERELGTQRMARGGAR